MTREEANMTIDYLKEIQESYIEGEGYERHPLPEWYALDKAIEAIEQKPRWIFVSERVPDKNGKYLVTRYGNILGSSVCILCYAENLYSIDSFDFNKKKGKSGWYDYDSEYGYVEFDNVIAWMPLPKPYNPQEESEETE